MSGNAAVSAVVLTHRRPRLARETVMSLLVDEQLPPERVILVIDRDGGLDDRDLERRIRTVRMSENLGPAAGFRAGMREAFADRTVSWAYLCEDDACLLGIPAPRLPGLVAVASRSGAGLGAVVVAGRQYIGRGDKTVVVVPDARGPRLQPVDVAAWGMTLLARPVVEAGVLPDDHWFFGYEDFDYFLRLRKAGFETYLDRDAGLAQIAASARTRNGTECDEPVNARKPAGSDEPWRAYYVTRNAFEMARRHGRKDWHAWHLAYSVRRWQLASPAARRAIVCGLRDGVRGKSGRHPLFVRTSGERSIASYPSSPDG